MILITYLPLLTIISILEWQGVKHLIQLQKWVVIWTSCLSDYIKELLLFETHQLNMYVYL